MKYSKQPLTIEQQTSLLKDRGLSIGDEAAARKILDTISYFRLANYFRPMETCKQSHQFKPGATFENAVLNIFQYYAHRFSVKTYKQRKFCENGTDCRPMVM